MCNLIYCHKIFLYFFVCFRFFPRKLIIEGLIYFSSAGIKSEDTAILLTNRHAYTWDLFCVTQSICLYTYVSSVISENKISSPVVYHKVSCDDFFH